MESLGFDVTEPTNQDISYIAPLGVRTFTRNHKKIQLIDIGWHNPDHEIDHETVVENYDFKHCMCSISNIRNNMSGYQFQFTCDHLRNIMTSTIDLNYDYKYSKSKLPIFTYNLFTDNQFFLKSQGAATTMRRIRKYEKRGFKCSVETSRVLVRWNQSLQEKVLKLQEFSTLFEESEVSMKKTI